MKFNLLIAEDEDNVRNILVSIVEIYFLKEYPFLKLNISTAENGKVALDIVNNERQDIILSDIVMPVMDGLEFIKNVRLFDKGVPILVLSALSSKEDVDKIMQSGATNYTTKPLNAKLFTTQIKVFVDFYLRRQNKYNHKAINLFSKNIYKRKIEFLIEKEDDLFEFWEFIIEGVFNKYRVEKVLHLIYDIELLMIKKGLSNTIVIEEDNSKFYITLLEIDKIEHEIIQEALNSHSLNEDAYLSDTFFMSLIIFKKEEDIKIEVAKKTPDSIKIDANTKKEVFHDIRYSIHEDITPNEFLSELDPSYEDKIENFLDDLSLLSVDIFSLETASYSEAKTTVKNINKYFNIFDDVLNSMGLFSVINRSFEHLIDFLDNLEDEILINSEKRVLLSKMLQGLADDLESWITMLFIERTAGDIHYFDASFSENCFAIASTFIESEDTDDDNEDDLEFF